MAFVLGEQVQLGLGVEAVRGTVVQPQTWIPARTPTGIVSVLDKTLIRETRGSGIASQGSELTQSRAEGDLEFNIRNTSIGYILYSLLGNVESTFADSAGTHIFTRQTEGPQNPSLTLALSQPGAQDFVYPLGVVSSLEIRTPVDDLVNATASFVAASENKVSDYTPAFNETSDILFRNHDVRIKFADKLADLDAAQPVCLNEFNITLANNSRPTQCIGNQTPSDIFSLTTEINGNFVVNFEDVADYYDVFRSAGYTAMRIEMIRDDLPTIGTSSLYNMIQIDLPRVSYETYTPDRPIDDIVTESVDFQAHFDQLENSAVTITIQNALSSYDGTFGS